MMTEFNPKGRTSPRNGAKRPNTAPATASAYTNDPDNPKIATHAAATCKIRRLRLHGREDVVFFIDRSKGV
jgi:hypothetical protein